MEMHGWIATNELCLPPAEILAYRPIDDKVHNARVLFVP